MSDTTTATAAASTTPAGAGATTAPASTGETAGKETQPLKGSLIAGEGGEGAGKDQGQTSGENKTTPAAEAEIEVKLPDGTNINQELLGGFKTAATTAKLNSEQASAIATWFAAEQVKADEGLVAEVTKRNEDWVAEVRADKDVGGTKFDESVRYTRDLMVKFPEARAELEKYGLANNPAVFRMLSRLGRSLSEDKSVSATTPGGLSPPTEAERNRMRYPNSR